MDLTAAQIKNRPTLDAPEFKLCHMASTLIYLIMHLALSRYAQNFFKFHTNYNIS